MSVISHNWAPYNLLQTITFPPLTKSWIGVLAQPLLTFCITSMPRNCLWKTQSSRQHRALKKEFLVGKMKSNAFV